MSDTSVSDLPLAGQGPNSDGDVERAGRRWLLLAHSLPATPAYLRVKVGRRLERIGAVAVKNSVYALPPGEDTLEDLQWLRREIAQGGGESSLCVATFLDDETDARLASAFERARNVDYRDILRAAEELRRALRSGTEDEPRQADEDARVRGLRERLRRVRAVDFFGASERGPAEAAVRSLEAALQRRAREAAAPGRGAERSVRGRTWVTRRGVKVDRISSSWLISRFIDPEGTFKFVTAGSYTPQRGELRFDMFDGEFTHVGNQCTFETLLRHFDLDDPALRALGEIVHDIDLKDERFGRPEVAGIASVIDGITARSRDDFERIRRGGEVLDGLYGWFAAPG